MRAAYDPQGGIEELLVDKLASVSWRQRRLLVAEGPEIRLGMELFERDFQNLQEQRAEEIGTKILNSEFTDAPPSGLISKICNPVVLERCLEMLSEIQNHIKEDGFEADAVLIGLGRIYGRDRFLRVGLRELYRNLVYTAQKSKAGDKSEDLETPAGCQKIFSERLSEEIRRLKEYQKKTASLESDRLQLQVLRHNVPESPGIDRLLKYEAALDRQFDRTLNRLERVQRTRNGLPIPPTLKVEFET